MGFLWTDFQAFMFPFPLLILRKIYTRANVSRDSENVPQIKSCEEEVIPVHFCLSLRFLGVLWLSSTLLNLPLDILLLQCNVIVMPLLAHNCFL